MAELIAVVGKPGTGKSTSIRTLDPSSTFIINVANKPLPFKGWKKKYTSFGKDKERGNYAATHDTETIGKVLAIVNAKRPEIKTIVLEDSSYLMSFEIFDRAKENSYTKHVEIAQHYTDILRSVSKLRDDLMVIVLTHPDEERDTFGDIKEQKMKTYGKMTDKYMSLDGLFTYIFFTKVLALDDSDNPEYRYVFETNDPSKISSAKTPMGCFSERFIDNDLKQVIEAIDLYNNGDEEEEETQDNE